MRELFKKYRIPLVLGLLLLSSLLIYSAHLRSRSNPSAFEQRMLAILSPVQKSTELVRSSGAAVWSFLFGASAAETARLREEILHLKAGQVALEELRAENQRLQRLLDFSTQLEHQPITARVIAVDATSWFRSITIDRGSLDGLHEGMAVVTEAGVVGRVMTCAPHSARVSLIVDPSSGISSLIERTRVRGVCRGTGDGLSLDYVELNDDLRSGDMLVTSGLGGGFPKGLVIGTVANVAQSGFDMFRSVQITPAVDFTRLEEVLVVTSTERASEAGR